jgi:hypothetical protein
LRPRQLAKEEQMGRVLGGLLPEESVSDVLARVLPTCDARSTLVIRSLDSSRDAQHLARALDHHGIHYQLVNGNICIPGDVLVRASLCDLFTGFDEVWILADRPPEMNLTDLPSATSETHDFSEGVPPALVEAMSKTRCVLILGDGCGLNYATTDPEVETHIQSQ